jgi:histidinol-phosphate aminotransferase
VSSINQQAALSALNNYALFEENLSIILAEKNRLKSELEAMGGVKKIYPSSANFLLIEVDDANLLYEKLVVKNIITRNRNTQVPNCLRISVGTPQENDQLLNALNLIL